MMFYNEKEQLYAETDASGAGLRAHHLYMKDRMQLSNIKALDNAAPQSIVFASKNLTISEMWTQQH